MESGRTSDTLRSDPYGSSEVRFCWFCSFLVLDDADPKSSEVQLTSDMTLRWSDGDDDVTVGGEGGGG